MNIDILEDNALINCLLDVEAEQLEELTDRRLQSEVYTAMSTLTK